MKFKKYQHIEKLGREECEGLLNVDAVYCFPKIDGTNSCLFLGEADTLQAGSRRCLLNDEQDNGGFYAWSKTQPQYLEYLKVHPNHILYGEFMIPHTIKSYDDAVWGNLYIFDVFEVDEKGMNSRYLSYEEYKPLLEEFNIVYIPCLAIKDHPSIEEIAELAKHNHYLMPDGSKAIGEGIVCKSYNYKNKWGRTIWGKFVAEEFFNKKQHLRSKNHDAKSNFEMKIAQEYITDSVIYKEYAKIKNEFLNASKNEMIGRVLNTVYETFLNEDLLTVVRKNKKCTINFQNLKKQSDNRVKEVLRDELF